MHTYVKALTQIASKYAPSRMLSFELVHIFKVFQLLAKNEHISRALLCEELSLGEGSVRTLVKHMRMQGLISSTNHGTTLTEKGKKISTALIRTITAETAVPTCSFAIGKFNYAVLLKHASFAIKSGIEQRDAAIKVDAIGATTLIYNNQKFMMPTSTLNRDHLNKDYDSQFEPEIVELLIEKLQPENKDVIIIGSDNSELTNAEFGAKNAALFTIMNHDKHVHEQ